MKQLHLDALRDIAIQYIPKAQQVYSIKGQSADDVTSFLFVTAFMTLGRPTSTATEVAASTLLQALMSLRMTMEPYQPELTSKERTSCIRNAIDAANDLFEITGAEPPKWLPTADKELPEEIPATQIASPKTQRQPTVQARPASGVILTTAAAARLLNRAPQTLRSWSSTQKGPLQPIKGGRALLWRSDDILRLMDEGWT